MTTARIRLLINCNLVTGPDVVAHPDGTFEVPVDSAMALVREGHAELVDPSAPRPETADKPRARDR